MEVKKITKVSVNTILAFFNELDKLFGYYYSDSGLSNMLSDYKVEKVKKTHH